MPIVYLVQSPRSDKLRERSIDFTTAAKFGKIVPILHEDVQPGHNTNLVILEIEKSLKDFNHNCDYLLHIIGDPLALFLVGGVLAKKPRPFWSYLRFSRKKDPVSRLPNGDADYIPIRIPNAV